MKDPGQLLQDFVAHHQRQARELVESLRTGVCPDGGLPAETFSDPAGAWPTAQALANLNWFELLPRDEAFLLGLRDWLLAHQNADGGWPFRSRGESFVDTSAWAILGLSYYPECADAARRGADWLLDAQRNEGTSVLAGWGVSPRECDRVYSTFIALISMHRMQQVEGTLTRGQRERVSAAIEEAIRWLLAERNADGGWGQHPGRPTDLANTIHALLVLAIFGKIDLRQQKEAFNLVRSQRLGSMTWPTITEILELSNGLDLRLSWFTTPWALWLWSLGLGAGLVEPEEILDCAQAMQQHVEGAKVSLSLDAKNLRTWAICDYLVGQQSVLRSISSAKPRFRAALAQQQRENTLKQRDRITQVVRNKYPFVVAWLFNAYTKGEGASAHRLQALLGLFEGTVRYLSSVALAIYVQSRMEDPNVDSVLREGLASPALGTWWRMLVEICRVRPSPPGAFLADFASNVLDIGGGKLARECEALIKLRNRTRGHGAPEFLPPAECDEHLRNTEDTIWRLMEALEFLASYDSFFIIDSCFDEMDAMETYRIRSCKGFDALFSERTIRTCQRLSRGIPERKVRYFYFQDRGSETAVNLFPFIVYRECAGCGREVVLMYNASRENKTEYLSYQCGHHTDVEVTDVFRKRLGKWLEGG